MSNTIDLAVDTVVFNYFNDSLHVLVLQEKSSSYNIYWKLPGGIVEEYDTLQDTVKKSLKVKANLKVDFLEQLHTFGDDISRDPRNRVVSVAYMGIVNPENDSFDNQLNSENYKWIPVQSMPNLAFDHNEMINLAYNRLKQKFSYQPIAFNFLPSKFLFSELENLYMNALNISLDRRNFRKKMLTYSFVEELNEYEKKKSGRPAMFYTFNKNEYQKFEIQGLIFDIRIT